MTARVPYRRNFALVLLLECCWAFGTWLAHPMTVLPDFLIRLGAGPVTVGLLPALWALGMGAGGLFVGAAVAHRGRLARFAGLLHYLATLPWLVLAAIALAAGRGLVSPAAGRTLALAGIFAFDLTIGFLLQIYFVLLARSFPERGRGGWFGWVFALSGLVGLAGPVAAGVLIRRQEGFPAYAAIFAAACACFAVGTAPIFFLVERRVAPLRRRSPLANLAALRAAWRANAPLRRYLAARMWLEPAVLCGAYMATYARGEGGWSEAAVTRLGTVVVAAEAAAAVGLGWLSARLALRHGSGPAPSSGEGLGRQRGRTRAAYLGAQWLAQAAAVGALLFAAAGPARPAAFLLAAGCGLRVAADFVIHPNILIEMGSRRSGTDLLALGAVVLVPALVLVPPAGGLVIDAVGHRAAFALAAAAAAVGLVQLGRLWREA